MWPARGGRGSDATSAAHRRQARAARATVAGSRSAPRPRRRGGPCSAGPRPAEGPRRRAPGGTSARYSPGMPRRPPPHQRRALGLAQPRPGGVEHVVVPRADRLCDGCLQLGLVTLAEFLAGPGAHDDVQPRERRLRTCTVCSAAPPSRASRSSVLDVLAPTRVVYRSRGRNTRQDGTRRRVVAQEHPGAAAFLQRRTPSAVRRTRRPRPACSSSRGKNSRMLTRSRAEWLPGANPARRSTSATFSSTTRDAPHALGVRAGGEQPQEPALARDSAFRVPSADAHASRSTTTGGRSLAHPPS